MGDADVARDRRAGPTSDDVTTLVAAALFAPPMRRPDGPGAAARHHRDRQLVAIAVAHLDGDADRVDELARDHLADHPDSVLVAWITPPAPPPHPKGPLMTLVTSTRSPPLPERQAGPLSFRPWYKWLLTALAFPPAGLVAHTSSPARGLGAAAVLNGFIAGAGIGAAQWVAASPPRGRPFWIAATAGGLGAGLAAGAALVSYRTDITSLAVMGAVSGLGCRRRPGRRRSATPARGRLDRSHRRAVGARVDRHHRRRHRRRPAVGRLRRVRVPHRRLPAEHRHRRVRAGQGGGG